MSQNKMPDTIYVGSMHENVSGEYELRCEVEKVGVDDVMYHADHVVSELRERNAELLTILHRFMIFLKMCEKENTFGLIDGADAHALVERAKKIIKKNGG